MNVFRGMADYATVRARMRRATRRGPPRAAHPVARARGRSDVSPGSATAPTLELAASKHRAGNRRRLVVPTRQRLRRPHRPHAELRSRRPRGRSLYACLRGGAVVLAVARGAPDGPGSPSAAGRWQPLGNVAKHVRRLPGFAGARRLRGRLHRKRLGPRAVRGRRPNEKPGRPPVQRL